MELLGENLTPSECYTKWKQMEAIKIQNHQNHCVCCGKSNHGCWDAPHEESETIYSERLDRFIDAECRVSTCLRESPMSRKLGSSFSVLSCACDATWESCKVLESWNETGSSATSVKTHSRLGMVQNWASNPASLVMFNVELSVLGGLNHTQVWYYAHPKILWFYMFLYVFVRYLTITLDGLCSLYMPIWNNHGMTARFSTQSMVRGQAQKSEPPRTKAPRTGP